MIQYSKLPSGGGQKGGRERERRGIGKRGWKSGGGNIGRLIMAGRVGARSGSDQRKEQG